MAQDILSYPKKRAYPKEIRELAIKMYYGGISARGVGKILHMSQSNVMNWIKKSLQTKSKEETAIAAKTVELLWN